MDEDLLLSSLNRYMNTEDSIPITRSSTFFQTALRDSILLHNESQADLLVQAFIGRYLMRSGEKIVVSLANRRIHRRELYPEIRHTLLEMMLVVAMATLAYVLLRSPNHSSSP
jgi:cation transport ATPase